MLLVCMYVCAKMKRWVNLLVQMKTSSMEEAPQGHKQMLWGLTKDVHLKFNYLMLNFYIDNEFLLSILAQWRYWLVNLLNLLTLHVLCYTQCELLWLKSNMTKMLRSSRPGSNSQRDCDSCKDSFTTQICDSYLSSCYNKHILYFRPIAHSWLYSN